MLSVEEANKAILKDCELKVATERVAIFDALNRIAAEDIYSLIDVPPADNSAMDGVAISSADSQSGRNTFSISQRIAAGDKWLPLEPKTAARIFTGGEIPEGADSVVIQENCQFEPSSVCFEGPTESGKNIRKRGQDIELGAKVVTEGNQLRPQELGLLASIGIAEVAVFKKLRVGVFSTGDELVEPGNSLEAGQIYSSNAYSLCGLIKESGCDFVNLGHLGDNLERTIDALRLGSSQVDILITTGGVSAGEEDYVKTAVESCGTVSIWKIAVKPGKPLAFGKIGNTPIFGLPGNPVSGFATFLLFVKPYLNSASGRTAKTLQWLKVTSGFQRKPPSREEYLRVRLREGVAEIFPNQSSGVLTSLSWGSGLARQKIGEEITAGTELDYLPFELF